MASSVANITSGDVTTTISTPVVLDSSSSTD